MITPTILPPTLGPASPVLSPPSNLKSDLRFWYQPFFSINETTFYASPPGDFSASLTLWPHVSQSPLRTTTVPPLPGWGRTDEELPGGMVPSWGRFPPFASKTYFAPPFCVQFILVLKLSLFFPGGVCEHSTSLPSSLMQEAFR